MLEVEELLVWCGDVLRFLGLDMQISFRLLRAFRPLPLMMHIPSIDGSVE